MRATTTVIAARRTSALSARPPSSSRAASSFSEAIGQLAEGGHGLEARWYIFAVIGVALLVDVSRIVVSVRTARRYKSAALRSNALHFAGDMAGTIAVLGGMVAVAGGFEQGDAVAALVVACLVFAAAGRLVYENARVLMDTAPADAQSRAAAAIKSLGDDIELRRLRLRESGGHYFADAVVGVSGQAVVEGHGTADAVEAAVRDALADTDVVVHLEPRREGLDLRDRALAVALAEPLVREAHDIAIYEHDGRASVSLHLKLAPDGPSPTPTQSRSASRPRFAGSPASRMCRPTSSPWSSPSPRIPAKTVPAPTTAARAHKAACRRPHRTAAARAAAAARRRRARRIRLRRSARRHDAARRLRGRQHARGRDPRPPNPYARRASAHPALPSPATGARRVS